MESGSDHRQALGKLGEDLACQFLEKHGHTILERNWRKGHLEIDIISSDSDGIHFVEVKTRKMNIQAPPQESVDRAKQQKVIKAAQWYLKSGKGRFCVNQECLFDIIAITFDADAERIDWFQQAYIPIFI